MKIILSVCLVITMVATAFASGIEGTWKTKMNGGNGDGMELTFVFKMEGEKLTGVVKMANEDLPITNAKIEGEKFSFDVAINDMVIKHECVFKADDTIAMKLKNLQMGDQEMVLKRVKN